MYKLPLSVVTAASLWLGDASGAVAAPVNYSCDPNHTEIRFNYSHAGFAQQSGEFDEFSCELTIDEDDFAASKLVVTIKAASISTGVKALDDDLKSANFLDVAKNPEIKFVSTAVKKRGKKGAVVTGDLTIKGVTNPLSLKVKLNKKGEHPIGKMLDAYKGQWAGFSAQAKLKRSDYKLDMLVPIVSDKVNLIINTEMKAK